MCFVLLSRNTVLYLTSVKGINSIVIWASLVTGLATFWCGWRLKKPLSSMLTVVHNVVSDLQQQEFAVISDIDNRSPNLRKPCFVASPWNLELNGISIFILFLFFYRGFNSSKHLSGVGLSGEWFHRLKISVLWITVMTAGSNPSAVKARMRPQQVTTTPLSISDKLRLQKPKGHRPIGVSLPPGHHLPASGSFINWPALAAAWRGRGQRSGTFKWRHLKWWHATCWNTKTCNNLSRARHCQCILNKALKNASVTAHYRLVRFLV